MVHDPRDAQQIRVHGWRQGSILPQSLVDHLCRKNLLPWQPLEEDAVMVLSHDCDVTNRDLNLEPNVELLRLSSLAGDKRSKGYQWGKNPRCYQLVDKAAGREVFYTASIHDRAVVRREFLLDDGPDRGRRFEPENVKRLCSWVARRYTRAAFPDAFNDRVRAASNALRRLLKSQGDLLTAIYVLAEEQELPEGSDYNVVLCATICTF